MSVTLKENMERETLCMWRYNLSTIETGIIYIGTAKTTLALTKHSSTSETPHKTIETLSPQMSEIRPYAVKYTGHQQELFNPS